jgi:hypothetical protein
MDTTNVILAQDKVKGTGKWQIDYLTPEFADGLVS